MIEFKEFEELYTDICKKHKSRPITVYNKYRQEVKPNIPLIGEFRAEDSPISELAIRKALGVGQNHWECMKEIFSDLNEALENKTKYMRLKSEIDLQKGINLSPDNGKLLDMELRLYNPKYLREKGQEVELPPTLKVEFVDGRKEIEETDNTEKH